MNMLTEKMLHPLFQKLLKMASICTHTSLEISSPFVNHLIDNCLLYTRLDCIQTLLQLVFLEVKAHFSIHSWAYGCSNWILMDWSLLKFVSFTPHISCCYVLPRTSFICISCREECEIAFACLVLPFSSWCKLELFCPTASLFWFSDIFLFICY